MFLLPFMTLEYPLILETHLKLFQRECNSLIKKFLLYITMAKHQYGRSSAPNDPSLHGNAIARKLEPYAVG